MPDTIASVEKAERKEGEVGRGAEADELVLEANPLDSKRGHNEMGEVPRLRQELFRFRPGGQSVREAFERA